MSHIPNCFMAYSYSMCQMLKLNFWPLNVPFHYHRWLYGSCNACQADDRSLSQSNLALTLTLFWSNFRSFSHLYINVWSITMGTIAALVVTVSSHLLKIVFVSRLFYKDMKVGLATTDKHGDGWKLTVLPLNSEIRWDSSTQYEWLQCRWVM